MAQSLILLEAMRFLTAGFHELVSLLTLPHFPVEGKSLGNKFHFSLLTDSAIGFGIHPSKQSLPS
jgi:hypothetical protein